ncbi:MAG TPA: chemotaxis protein CheV [Alcaligenaceae bacterium]|nr:chemotaxis protein CheV [Alcaligenaceae bacterium]
MSSVQHEIDERTSLTGSNKFELLLFRLGNGSIPEQSELFGINVFKVREIVTIPTITPIAGAPQFSRGVVRLREQVIPVFDLPAIVGCQPEKEPTLMIVTEYARSTQAFIVESVEDIVRLEWSQVISAEASDVAGSLVTSIARLEDDTDGSRLIQVLDVEAILQKISPMQTKHDDQLKAVDHSVQLKPGTIILAADDSIVARSLMQKALETMDVPFEMVKSGKEAWDRLNDLARAAEAEGKTIYDKVSLVLSDLEMPEMDGFTLTRNIKQDSRFNRLPVVIHSSLSGATNEEHVRRVGADGYVVKFAAEELTTTIRNVLAR